MPIRSGDQFRGELIEDAIDAMTYVAGTVGYAIVDITPLVERDRENRVVNITFEVNEGPRVYIERIDIVGNTRTLDHVIRREMRVTEGDAFNRVLLDRSRQRVQSLGFFKEVDSRRGRGSQPDRSVVTVTVEEQSTGELAFAAGYSSSESLPVRRLDHRAQLARPRPVPAPARLDRARSASRSICASPSRASWAATWPPASTSIRCAPTSSSQSSFENQSTGIGLRLGFPIAERTSLGLTYSLIQDDTEIADGFVDHDNNTFDAGDRSVRSG